MKNKEKEKEKKDELEKAGRRKIFSAILALLLMSLVVFLMYWLWPSPSEDERSGSGGVKKTTWMLCWLAMNTCPSQTEEKWETTGMCGDVTEIRFDNTGEVLSMTTRHSSGWITKFLRVQSNQRGVWTTATHSGWWTLKKIGPNQFEGTCRGNEKGDKIRQLILSLE